MAQLTNMQELLNQISADANFKSAFIANPKATLAEVGVQVADEVELTVLEESEDNIHLVIPTADNALEVSDNDLIAQLIARAASDAALRQEMLADPKAVIARETGLVIPSEANVQVFEQTATKAYFVLPQISGDDERELSESELEVVAGGFFSSIISFSKRYCVKIANTIITGLRGCFGIG